MFGLVTVFVNFEELSDFLSSLISFDELFDVVTTSTNYEELFDFTWMLTFAGEKSDSKSSIMLGLVLIS